LYIALFQFWNINRFQNPISISRDEVMRISKIASKATYHKCMRELNDSGYVKYEPSFNPYRGSMVVLFNFSETPEPYQKKDRSPQPGVSNFGPALNEQRTGLQTAPETAIEQALVSSINTTNITNLSNLENVSNLEELPPFFELDESIFKNQITVSAKEKKLDEKKNPISPPGKQEVQMYFHSQAFPEVEAHKFFNYFSSIGWLVGGKARWWTGKPPRKTGCLTPLNSPPAKPLPTGPRISTLALIKTMASPFRPRHCLAFRP